MEPANTATIVRVLLLTDEMEVGGTQRQIVHIARRLDRRRFAPAVAYFRNRSRLVDELEQAGIAVTDLGKKHRVDVPFLARLRKLIRNGEFDVMHCFAFSGELWGTVARRLEPPRRRPALITSVRALYDWYSGAQWRVKRWVYSESYKVIANSGAGAEFACKRMRLPAGSIDVVFNGVEATAAQSDNGRLPPPGTDAGARDVTALFVGRLVEQKNLPVLLRAMKDLRDRQTGIRLWIAGDGPARAHCEGEIDALGLRGCVHVLGDRDDVPALMAASDFVVQPSVREGLSNTILEAMLAGRAVVASAVGGNVELVQQMETGLLVPSDDEKALADAMLRLAGEPLLRKRLGENARSRATERFTVDAMVRSMERIYLDAAAAAGRAS